MVIDSIQGKDVKTSQKTHLKKATKEILEASKQSNKPIKRKLILKTKLEKDKKNQIIHINDAMTNMNEIIKKQYKNWLSFCF